MKQEEPAVMQGELMIGAKDTRGCEALAALLVRGPALQQLNLRNEGRLSFCHTFFPSLCVPFMVSGRHDGPFR